ncbi:hypothetical protein [Bacillus sp. PK3-130]
MFHKYAKKSSNMIQDCQTDEWHDLQMVHIKYFTTIHFKNKARNT